MSAPPVGIAPRLFNGLKLWLTPLSEPTDCGVQTTGKRDGGWYVARAGVAHDRLVAMLDHDEPLMTDEAEAFGKCIMGLLAAEDRHNPPPQPIRSEGIPRKPGVVEGTIAGVYQVRLSAHPENPDLTVVELETGSRGWFRREIMQRFDGHMTDSQLVREAVADMAKERGPK